MGRPSFSRKSALPDFEVSARLPCLNTGTRAAATTKAAAVETLKLPEWSPPVPHTSTARPAQASTCGLRARPRKVLGKFRQQIRRPQILGQFAQEIRLRRGVHALAGEGLRGAGGLERVAAPRAQLGEQVVKGAGCRRAWLGETAGHRAAVIAAPGRFDK